MESFIASAMRRRRYRKSLNLYQVAQQFFESARHSLQLKHYAMLMVVMAPREKWTDDRLDDLNKKVDELKVEMRESFARVDADIRELRSDIKELNARFDTLNGRMIGGFFVVIAAVIGSNAFF
jgi:hypothetical protein